MAELALTLEHSKPRLVRQELADLSRRLREPPERMAWRDRAMDLLAAMPVPDRVRHLWRYTDPADLYPPAWLTPSGPAALVDGPAVPAGGASASLVPGTTPWIQLDPAAREAGLEVVPLATADPSIAAALGSAVGPEHGLFEALDAAAHATGVAIRVPAGVRLAGPIHVALPLGVQTTVARLLVIVEQGAEAVILEEHLAGGDRHVAIGVTEVIAGPGARVHHLVHQHWSPGTRGHLTSRAVLDRDAEVRTVFSSFGGAIAKADIGAVLRGEGARSELLGLVLGEKRQHLDHHTEHRHEVGNTWSNIDLRVALSGRARSAYTGLIRIDEDARETEAYQENRNLLLSRRARADSIPELEILNQDVSCTHGATVAPVDDEPLFYLQSRGIDPQEARRQILRGFFEQVLQRVPEAIRGGVVDGLERRLARIGGAG